MTAEPDSGAARAPGRPAAAPGPAVDVFLPAGQFPGASHGDALRAATAYAQAAEAAGFHGAWLAEHHFIGYGVCPSAVAFAGYLLGRTSRLRVGTAAAILSNRHPVALAEEAVLLDELSGGRFDLGVARGGPWVDLEVFGTGPERLHPDGFAEALDLLTAWRSGAARIGGDGPLFRFRPVAVVPRPAAARPVWVAATSAGTVELAAARGLPLLLGVHATDAEKKDLLDRYADAAARHGHDPAGVPHASAHLAYVADCGRRAVDDLRAAMPAWLATTAQYVRLDGTAGPARDLDAYLAHLLEIHPVGDPAECVERLAASLAATGVRRLLLMVEGAGDPVRTTESIARLGAEVLPLLR
ncbi:MAG TPA: LLM class flavin-dependent oxidoreductase [Pilimelia sp.]|nr:LLM class flavin-dependent oxidoreductase [Pilimelia sp.]